MVLPIAKMLVFLEVEEMTLSRVLLDFLIFVSAPGNCVLGNVLDKTVTGY